MTSDKRLNLGGAKRAEYPDRTHIHACISINAYTETMGRRRGRPSSSTRLRAEDCAALPVRLLPDLPPRGSPIKHLEIGIVNETPGFNPVTATLRLYRSSRGWRCLCPRCGRSAASIYFPLESREPGCRVCLGLVYGSQYEMSGDALWNRFVASRGGQLTCPPVESTGCTLDFDGAPPGCIFGARGVASDTP